MEPRTIGALALRPTGNVQGGFYFYNLATGCIIGRRKWTCLPMPSEVIETIHTLAKIDKAKEGISHDEGAHDQHNDFAGVDTDVAEVQNNYEDNYENQENENFGYDNVIDNMIDNHDPQIIEVDTAGDRSHDSDDTTGEITGVSDNENSPHRTTGVEDDDYGDGSRDHDEPVDDDYEGDEIGIDSINGHTNTVTPEDIDMHGNVDGDDGWDEQTANESPTGDDDTRIDHAPTGSETDIQAIMDERYGARNGRYNLRPRRERNVNGYNAILFNTSPVQEGGYIQGFTLTQYNVKQGLKIFGKQVNWQCPQSLSRYTQEKSLSQNIHMN